MFWKNLSQNREMLPNIEPEVFGLFEDILKTGADLRVKVTGRSMAPFLKGGEILTIKKVPYSSLRKGDLIFFRDLHGSHVLHRLVEKRRVRDNIFVFRTKGDAMKSFDEPVHQNEVLGKVCRIERTSSSVSSIHLDMESDIWRKVNFSVALINLIKTQVYRAVSRYLKTCFANKSQRFMLKKTRLLLPKSRVRNDTS